MAFPTRITPEIMTKVISQLRIFDTYHELVGLLE